MLPIEFSLINHSALCSRSYWPIYVYIRFQIVVVWVLTLPHWTWRPHVDKKRFSPPNTVHCVTTHKTIIWTPTATKTSTILNVCFVKRASSQLCFYYLPWNNTSALEMLKCDSTCSWIAFHRAGYLMFPWISLIWSLYWWPEECASRSLFRLAPRELKWSTCSNGQTCICTGEKGVKRLVGWHKPLSRAYLSSR